MTPEEVDLLERLIERNAQLREFVAGLLLREGIPEPVKAEAAKVLRVKYEPQQAT